MHLFYLRYFRSLRVLIGLVLFFIGGFPGVSKAAEVGSERQSQIVPPEVTEGLSLGAQHLLGIQPKDLPAFFVTLRDGARLGEASTGPLSLKSAIQGLGEIVNDPQDPPPADLQLFLAKSLVETGKDVATSLDLRHEAWRVLETALPFLAQTAKEGSTQGDIRTEVVQLLRDVTVESVASCQTLAGTVLGELLSILSETIRQPHLPEEIRTGLKRILLRVRQDSALPASVTSRILTTRQHFEQSLLDIQRALYAQKLPKIQRKYNVFAPNIFLSYAWKDDTKEWVDSVVSKDLAKVGFDVLYDQPRITPGREIGAFEEKISRVTYVVMLCTPQYKKRFLEHNQPTSTGVGREVERILQRLRSQDLAGTVFPIYAEGDFDECLPDIPELRALRAFPAQRENEYCETIFDLAQSLFLYTCLHDQPIKSFKDAFFAATRTPPATDGNFQAILGSAGQPDPPAEAVRKLLTFARENPEGAIRNLEACARSHDANYRDCALRALGRIALKIPRQGKAIAELLGKLALDHRFPEEGQERAASVLLTIATQASPATSPPSSSDAASFGASFAASPRGGGQRSVSPMPPRAASPLTSLQAASPQVSSSQIDFRGIDSQAEVHEEGVTESIQESIDGLRRIARDGASDGLKKGALVKIGKVVTSSKAPEIAKRTGIETLRGSARNFSQELRICAVQELGNAIESPALSVDLKAFGIQALEETFEGEEATQRVQESILHQLTKIALKASAPGNRPSSIAILQKVAGESRMLEPVRENAMRCLGKIALHGGTSAEEGAALLGRLRELSEDPDLSEELREKLKKELETAPALSRRAVSSTGSGAGDQSPKGACVVS